MGETQAGDTITWRTSRSWRWTGCREHWARDVGMQGWDADIKPNVCTRNLETLLPGERFNSGDGSDAASTGRERLQRWGRIHKRQWMSHRPTDSWSIPSQARLSP